MAVRLSALHAGLPLPPQEDFWYSFLLEAESTSGHSAAGRIRLIEKSSGFIGNRTRDLHACSTVPQPTTLRRTHETYTLQTPKSQININSEHPWKPKLNNIKDVCDLYSFVTFYEL
jgi:hypothetical protein